MRKLATVALLIAVLLVIAGCGNPLKGIGGSAHNASLTQLTPAELAVFNFITQNGAAIQNNMTIYKDLPAQPQGADRAWAYTRYVDAEFVMSRISDRWSQLQFTGGNVAALSQDFGAT